MSQEELERLKQEFLKTKEIKVIGEDKKDTFKPDGILTIYSYGEIQKVV